MKNLGFLCAFLLVLMVPSAIVGIRETCQEDEQKCYLAPLQWYGNIAYSGFDNCHQEEPLSRLLFLKDFTIQDIFLLSKLSNDNKMRNANIDALAPVRPGGAPEPFGNYRTDQYLSNMATIKVKIDAEQRQQNFNLGASVRRQLCDYECTFYSIGFNIPIVSILHVMDLHFNNGDLSFENRPLGGNIAQTVLAEFFKDFIDMRDFFDRAILQPKGLTFIERQRKIGVGDISLYGTIEQTGICQYFDVAQFGLNLVLPSGNKRNGKKIWEIELGNGGAFQVEGSLSLFFSTSSALFNPVLRLVGQGSAPFTGIRRLPVLREQTQTPRILIGNFDDLLAPIDTFRGNYFVDPFKEFDSSVPYFSDLAVKTRVRYGARFLVSVGNYFYNLFNSDFRFGVFYDFMHKSHDEICALDTTRTFDNRLLEINTEQTFHRFGWSLSRCCCSPNIEFTIGSQHIIAGKNIARTQEAFVSMSIVF